MIHLDYRKDRVKEITELYGSLREAKNRKRELILDGAYFVDIHEELDREDYERYYGCS